MANGNNRAGKQPRAHFQLAGGTSMQFKHPYLAGQIDTASANVDTIDISACCKLEGRYFEATQNQDSAKQTVLVDGSVVTICNKLLNGIIAMPVIQTTGIVATGDFIAALQLIKSTGDSVGGILIKNKPINGKMLTRVYYGVTVKSCPDDICEGNDVPVYNVQLYYAGWIEAISTNTAENKKRIWAVGAKSGIEAFYSPYSTQNQNGEAGTQSSPLTTTNSGLTGEAATLSDDYASDVDTHDDTTEAKVVSGEWGTDADGQALVREASSIDN